MGSMGNTLQFFSNMEKMKQESKQKIHHAKAKTNSESIHCMSMKSGEEVAKTKRSEKMRNLKKKNTLFIDTLMPDTVTSHKINFKN